MWCSPSLSGLNVCAAGTGSIWTTVFSFWSFDLIWDIYWTFTITVQITTGAKCGTEHASPCIRNHWSRLCIWWGPCCCSLFFDGVFTPIIDSFSHWGRVVVTRSFFNIDFLFLDICLSSYWSMLFRCLELVGVMKYVELPQFLIIVCRLNFLSFFLSLYPPFFSPFSELRHLFTP